MPTVHSIAPTSPTMEANTIESYFTNHPFFWDTLYTPRPTLDNEKIILKNLRVHLPLPPEYGLRPACRVQHPLHPRHPHSCRGLKNDGYDDGCLLEAKIGENNDKIYNFHQIYIVSDLGQRWGCLRWGGCCTLHAGLRPCSGGKGSWTWRIF